MGTEVITRYVYIENTGYQIIDNKMDKKMAINVIDVASSAFFQKSDISEKCEYIKTRLEDIYSNICWSCFIYSDGYCKVSFDENLYICGKANEKYIINFGHYKNTTIN